MKMMLVRMLIVFVEGVPICSLYKTLARNLCCCMILVAAAAEWFDSLGYTSLLLAYDVISAGCQ